MGWIYRFHRFVGQLLLSDGQQARIKARNATLPVLLIEGISQRSCTLNKLRRDRARIR